MKPRKHKSVDAGSRRPLSQWLGWWQNTVLQAPCDTVAWHVWRVAAAEPTHPDSPAEIFIVLSAFYNEMGSRLANPHCEEKYWVSKYRQAAKFREWSTYHLCAVKTQWILYLFSALCLSACCIIHAREFGTQLVPLSKIESSNAC